MKKMMVLIVLVFGLGAMGCGDLEGLIPDGNEGSACLDLGFDKAGPHSGFSLDCNEGLVCDTSQSIGDLVCAPLLELIEGEVDDWYEALIAAGVPEELAAIVMVTPEAFAFVCEIAGEINIDFVGVCVAE